MKEVNRTQIENDKAVLIRFRTKCYNRDPQVTLVLVRKKMYIYSVLTYSLGEDRYQPHIFREQIPSFVIPPSLGDSFHPHFPK